MGYNNTAILRDMNGNPIPQIYDSEKKLFVPYEGKVQLSGTVVELGCRVL